MISKRNLILGVFFTIIAFFLVFSMLTMVIPHPFGQPQVSDMDDEILSNAQEETGANNAVTSVVFDYRGFDTLGEATILFTAVAGVMLIYRRLVHE